MNLKGDCIEVMKAMKPNSMDAIVTDPPYGLEFMGKEWDKLWNKHENDETRSEGRKARKFQIASPQYKAGLQAQLWHTQWLIEAYRVLKPGGSMLVMGGTRTSHRLACAIEDTGFIIKDTLMWLYGSGFPKAQDLGKMIDKRGGDGEKWDGFKVGGIKPAYEPIIWAVKPPEGSYVDNVLKHGVGAVNVDATRISHNGNLTKGGCTKYGGMFGNDGKVNNPDGNSKGRFPANVILSHHPECVQVGVKKAKSPKHRNPSNGASKFCHSEIMPRTDRAIYDQSDPDGYEQVESWDCHTECPIRLLDEQSGNLQSGANPERRSSAKTKTCYGEFEGQKNCISYRGKDNGGASRFFYCAKASRGERNAGLEGMEEKVEHTTMSGANINKSNHQFSDGAKRTGIRQSVKNNHPTVKPIKLFEYLIKLVTREGQVVLDPFIGSGTTSIATHNTGRKCIGIEKEGEYLEIAKRRISYWQNQPKQNSLNLGG